MDHKGEGSIKACASIATFLCHWLSLYLKLVHYQKIENVQTLLLFLKKAVKPTHLADYRPISLTSQVIAKGFRINCIAISSITKENLFIIINMKPCFTNFPRLDTCYWSGVCSAWILSILIISVPHQRFLYKLSKYGICDKVATSVDNKFSY